MRKFWIKCKYWEYWPTQIVYLPIYIYHKFLALRLGYYFYFTNVNPDMEMGGLFFASKYKALKKLPQYLYPKTLFLEVDKKSSIHLENALNEANIPFPCLVKPDRLERGTGIQIIKDIEMLERYLAKNHFDVLIQELIHDSFEAGIFFWRNSDGSIEIPSIVTKEFLSITGDGMTSLSTYIKKNERAYLHAEKLKANYPEYWINPIPAGHHITLEPIGNHSRGTKFLDGRHLFTAQIQSATEEICAHLSNHNYGRIDLRCPTEEDFKSGLNYKILEINGVNAEPAHIYQPGFLLWEAWKTLIKHWSKMASISMQQKNKGFKPISFAQGLKSFLDYKNLSKMTTLNV